MITHDFYDLLFEKFVSAVRQTLWLKNAHYLHPFPILHNACGFRKLVRLLAYASHSFRHSAAYFFDLYHPYCLYVSQGISDLDLHRMYYHIYGEHGGCLGCPQKLIPMIRDGQVEFSFYHPLPLPHTHWMILYRQSISNKLHHYIKVLMMFCLLSSKTVLCILSYNLFAFQTPVLSCQAPDASIIAG